MDLRSSRWHLPMSLDQNIRRCEDVADLARHRSRARDEIPNAVSSRPPSTSDGNRTDRWASVVQRLTESFCLMRYRARKTKEMIWKIRRDLRWRLPMPNRPWPMHSNSWIFSSAMLDFFMLVTGDELAWRCCVLWLRSAVERCGRF